MSHRRGAMVALALRSVSATLVSFTVLATIVASPSGAQDVSLTPVAPVYEVELTTGEHGRVWTGTEAISFTNAGAEVLDAVYLRLWSNRDDACDDSPAITISDVVGGVAAPLEVRCTAVRIDLDEPLAPGANGELSMNLELRIPRQDWRFGAHRGLVAAGNALPVLAIHDDEGWHLEPQGIGESFYSVVGDWRVTLHAPPSLDTPTTGSLVSTVTTPEGLESRVYEAPDVRDFAWAAGELRRMREIAGDGTGVNLWYRPGSVPNRETASLLLSIAAGSVAMFSESFGQYPYPELDVVIAGPGMEYPGLVLSPDVDYVISHEIAHQWWYGIVGNDQFEDPWLDEGLATWSMWMPLETGPLTRCRREPWPNDEVRLTSSMEYWNEHPDQYWIPYFQAACAFARLARVFGLERFIDILRGFAADNWLGIATTAEFQAAIEAAATEDGLDWNADGFWQRWRIGQAPP